MSDKLDALVPDVTTTTYVIAGRTYQLESMCAFKVAQILKQLSRFSDDVKLVDIIEAIAVAQGQVNIGQLTTTFLPRLMATAPDALVNLIALAVIPNAELETLFDTPGEIEKRMAAETKFLNFKATSAEVAELAGLCIPLIGLDALKKAIPALGQRVMASLGLQAPQASES